MEIKKAVYKKVKRVQTVMVKDAVYGCDHCKKEIKDYPNEEGRLELTVFYQDSHTEHLHYCSWDCVLMDIPKIKTDDFFNLPYVIFDEKVPNKRSGNRS